MSAGRPAAPSGGSRRGWGWHPLTDEWATRIVEGSGVRPGELVLDIGAGTGALTAPLVRAGARVIAVELHPGRAERLAARFAGAPVTVLRIDARDLRLPHRTFRVVSSPPYGIGSALLRLLTARGSRMVAADLVLQRAVVRRWADGGRGPAASGRGAAGRRSGGDARPDRVSARREGVSARSGGGVGASAPSGGGRATLGGGRVLDGRWTVTVGQRLPRSAFRVAPQVDSDVLVIRRR